MGKTFIHKAITCFAVAFSVPALNSCVEEKYDMSGDRINTEVTVFQEGLTLPLGKTKPITLASVMELLDSSAREILTTRDGAYLFRMADTLDFTNELEGVSDVIDIKRIGIDENIRFNLSNIDLSGMTFPGPEIKPVVVDVAGKLKVPDIKLPEFKLNPPFSEKVEIEKPDPDKLSFDTQERSRSVPYASLEGTVVASDEFLQKNADIANEEMPYADLMRKIALLPGAPLLPQMNMETVIKEEEIEVPIKIELPPQIRSIEEIELNKNAAVEVDVVVENSLFTSGKILPSIDVDLHNILHLNHSESGVTADNHLKDNFVVSSSNGWRENHEYHVESLAIEPSDFRKADKDSPLVLDTVIVVTASGTIATEGLKTTLKYLHDHTDGKMRMKVTVRFKNFSIDNIRMRIEPVVVEHEVSMPINISGVKLPDMVEKVEYVTLDESNPLTVSMKTSIPSAFKDLKVNLESMDVVFPEGLEVNDSRFVKGTNTLHLYNNLPLISTIANASGDHGVELEDNIVINKIYFPDPVGGSLIYNGEAKVKVVAKADGIINSRDLLASSSCDIAVEANVEYAPKLSDFSVITKDINQDVNVSPEPFNEPLPSDAGKFEHISVQLEKVGGNDPTICINLDYPQLDALSILPKAEEGLHIVLPKFIVLGELGDLYTYYNPDYGSDSQSISFTGNRPIPREIRIPVRGLDITPVEKNGGYYVTGEIKVIGGVRVAGVSVTKSTLEELIDSEAKVSFTADIPDFKPAQLAVGEYVAPINKSIAFDGIKMGKLPEMIKSVGDITLKDVNLYLEMDASSITSVVKNPDLLLNVDVSLPKIVVIEGAESGNVIHIEERMNKDGKIVIGPYKVQKLDLSSVDFGAEEVSLGNMNIAVVGNAVLKNADVDLDKLGKEGLQVSVTGSIGSGDTDKIEIDKISAVVDYQIAPMGQSIDFSPLLDAIGDKIDLVLDLYRFNAAMEIKTNLGIPVGADLMITPYSGGQALEPLKPSKSLVLNSSDTAADTVYTRYWVSNTAKGCPSGYEPVILDLLSLLKDRPDSIKVSLGAGTAQNATCVFEPTADYILKANYALEVPLELGSDFLIEFCDTLSLPDGIDQILSRGSLALGGRITNGLPLQLDMEVILLDADGKPVEMLENAGKQAINACMLDGTPVVSDLKFLIGVKKGVVVPPISAVKMKFSATSGGISGGAFREDSFIQVELNASVPEGLSADLKEIVPVEGDSEDNEN